MCMLLFLSITCKRSWLLFAMCIRFCIWSPHVVSSPAVLLDLTNSMSRNRPALGPAYIVSCGKLTDGKAEGEKHLSQHLCFGVFRDIPGQLQEPCILQPYIFLPLQIKLNCLQRDDYCFMLQLGREMSLSLCWTDVFYDRISVYLLWNCESKSRCLKA